MPAGDVHPNAPDKAMSPEEQVWTATMALKNMFSCLTAPAGPLHQVHHINRAGYRALYTLLLNQLSSTAASIEAALRFVGEPNHGHIHDAANAKHTRTNNAENPDQVRS